MEDVFGLVGLTLENKYIIEAVVATGGFGVVYRARHAVLGAPFAVKALKIPETLPRRMHAAFVQQFFEEARIVSQLQHPCIVRVVDFGVMLLADGQQAPWMALEWIEGETLSQHLAARRGAGGRLPREVLALMRPVLEAVALAHERGVVHRDLKPGNLMIPKLDLATTTTTGTRGSSRPVTPMLRLLDFGLAKVIEESDGPVSGQTRTTSAMPAFSPRYASPEQASGTRTGPWTDVHALGLIITELLVDAPPYKASDKMTLQIKVMSPTRPTPASFGVDVGAWEPVLAKALALLPADRYANAGELLDALEATVPERVTSLPGVRSSGEVANALSPPEVAHTTSPTTTIVTAPPTQRTWRTWVSAVGLVALGAVTAGIALRLSSSGISRANSGHAAAPSALPSSSVQPPVPPLPVLPLPVPQPSTPAAPVSEEGDGTVAGVDAVVEATAVAHEAPRPRRGRLLRINRVRPWEQ